MAPKQDVALMGSLDVKRVSPKTFPIPQSENRVTAKDFQKRGYIKARGYIADMFHRLLKRKRRRISGVYRRIPRRILDVKFFEFLNEK